MSTTKRDEKNDDAEETERLLLEELARREQQQQQNKDKTSSSSQSSLLLQTASGANKVVSATFSAFNETLSTILDTTKEQEEEDKFWESVPVLPPLKEGEEYDEDDDGRRTSSQEEGVLLYSGEDDAYINHHNMRREKNAMLLGEEEYDEDDGMGRGNNNSQSGIITGGGGGGGNFVADLLVNTYKQAQEAEEMLERRKRENVLNELDNWTTTTSATTNRVLDFDNMDDTNTEEGEKNHNNKNANNSAKMNADVRVGLTERYSSYLAKVLPIKSTKRRKNNGINDGKLIDGDHDGDDDDDDKRFEKIKSTFMSDEAQRELDKLEASFTPQRKSKKSFFRDFLQFGNNGSQNNAKNTQRGAGGELLLDDPALLAAVSKEMSKIDKVLNDLKTDVAIKNLANVARNTGGGRLNSFADALDALARHPMWEYQIVRNAAMIALLALFTFGIYLKISIESREEVGGLIDVGIQKSSRLGRRKFTGR